MAQVDLKDATIKIKDNGANNIIVKIGDGNLSYSEKQNVEYKLDRGRLDEVRQGDEVPVDVSFNFMWLYIEPGSGQSTAGGTVTIEDAIKGVGTAAAWVSTDSDACRPYAVDLEVVLDPTCADRKQTITLPDFRWESLEHDLKAASVSCSGKCNVTVATVNHD